MIEDAPIIAEIRKIREAHAAKFNYDIHAIFAPTAARKRPDVRDPAAAAHRADGESVGTAARCGRAVRHELCRRIVTNGKAK
jgi:hypothetical protein